MRIGSTVRKFPASPRFNPHQAFAMLARHAIGRPGDLRRRPGRFPALWLARLPDVARFPGDARIVRVGGGWSAACAAPFPFHDGPRCCAGVATSCAVGDLNRTKRRAEVCDQLTRFRITFRHGAWRSSFRPAVRAVRAFRFDKRLQSGRSGRRLLAGRSCHLTEDLHR